MSHNEDAYLEQLQPLAEGDAELLKTLVSRFAGQPFSEQIWEGISSISRSGAELKLSFIRLRKYGWVHAVKKSWGERLYYIPVEKLIRLLPIFFSCNHEHPSESGGLHSRCDSGSGLALDLLHVLAFAAEQGLPLTAKGTVHKKNLQKLQERISLKEEHLQRLALQYAHDEAYTPPLAVIFDLMLCMGLLSKTADAFVVEDKRLGEWLSLNEADMNRLLLRTVVERYGQTDAGMQLFRYMICMLPQHEGAWINIASVLEWMKGEGLFVADDAVEKAAAWLYALAGFGWGEVAVTEEGEYVFRWSIRPELLSAIGVEESENGDERFFVQPDFDIICPPGVPYLARWKLLVCTDLVQCDRVSVYKLTRESVARAVEKGMDIPDILDFLAAKGAEGIPEHVAAAIGQWGKQIGRTQFAEAVLLSCMSESEGDAIAGNPRIAGSAERIGPRHFIVEPSHMTGLRKILEGMGLAPLKAVAGSGRTDYAYPLLHVDAAVNGEMLSESYYERQGMVYGGRNVHFFEPDEVIPDPASLFPGVEQVPARWLQDWRSYHSSTARTIVEQAQSWQTKILLSHGGKRAEFAPTAVYPSPWRAEGILHDLESGRFERHELTAEDIGELKLILPSFD
ncbi:helicase-associated domain-containing protein [Paenibacillus azoreducens]|uniref:Helicase XPB/Ssl2 N-terminal domain-containing protein n=1 Tax=Paenibacillus azoreducens TaxID=116718 RepID=A0A919YG00_9BACL|nr:helicase-associated domain-containing protein [Paenibacillus azoreducens]GIO49769.1 hypothetical protein J34TS1_45340 [Paenibacillus azoreducens]